MHQIRPKIKSILKMVGDFLSTFVTAVIAIIAVLFVVIKLLGWNMFSIDSPSMSPKYPVDTLVVVRKIEPEKIRSGDVITFVLNEEGTLATHRVIRVNSTDETFTTKGDANNSEDATPVQWGNTIGKVAFGIPWLGKPMRIFTAEENRPFVMAVLAILFMLSLVWDITIKKKIYPEINASETLSKDGFPKR